MQDGFRPRGAREGIDGGKKALKGLEKALRGSELPSRPGEGRQGCEGQDRKGQKGLEEGV